MENKTYSTLSLNNNLTSANTTTTTTTTSNSFVLSPSKNTSSTTTTTTPATTPITSSLQTLQTIPSIQSAEVYIDNTKNNELTSIITQPIINKLSSETIKQERLEDNFVNTNYSIIQNRQTNNTHQITKINPVHIIPHETINNLSNISMANMNNHITSSYLQNGLPNDITSNYKLPTSSNCDLPSPSNSSNSSNTPVLNKNQEKRHGGNGDTKKREVRLQKNREAARECRRKKKEYIKCLEARILSLENQNRALIDELRHLKELYCQREEPKISTNNNNKTSTTTTNR